MEVKHGDVHLASVSESHNRINGFSAGRKVDGMDGVEPVRGKIADFCDGVVQACA